MESAKGMPYLAPYLASKDGLCFLAFSRAHLLGAAQDPEKLKMALATLYERKETVQKLAGVLMEIQQHGEQA